jgi:hypothetical protein
MTALEIVTFLVSVGAFTMALVAYRRSAAIKNTEIRIPLRKELATLRVASAALLARFDRAKSSSRSAADDAVESERQLDRHTVENIVARLPPIDETFYGLNRSGLENKVVEIHDDSLQIRRLTEKYR